MAWSPQARAAAIASRKSHAHGPMIKMNGHHGIKGGKTQPLSRHGHKGTKVGSYLSAPHPGNFKGRGGKPLTRGQVYAARGAGVALGAAAGYAQHKQFQRVVARQHSKAYHPSAQRSVPKSKMSNLQKAKMQHSVKKTIKRL